MKACKREGGRERAGERERADRNRDTERQRENVCMYKRERKSEREREREEGREGGREREIACELVTQEHGCSGGGILLRALLSRTLGAEALST